MFSFSIYLYTLYNYSLLLVRPRAAEHREQRVLAVGQLGGRRRIELLPGAVPADRPDGDGGARHVLLPLLPHDVRHRSARHSHQ